MQLTDFLQSPLALMLLTPPLLVVLLALGRLLKRRGGVRLGVSYQLFSLALACFVPACFLSPEPWLFDALATVVILLGVSFLLALLRRFVWEYYFRELHHTPVPKHVQEVVALAAYLIAILAVLTFIYDVRIPGLVAGSGIVAVILGLALQDTLGNIFAGFALHFGKPFKPGDWLMIDQRHAEVMEINWRSTRLRTNDNTYFDIPNNQINKQVIINLSYPDRAHAMRLSIRVDGQTAPSEVKDALLHAARQAPGVLGHPAPKVFLSALGDSALTYDIKFWLEDHALYNDITDAIRSNVWYELRRLSIPFPMRLIHFEKARPAGDRTRTHLSELLRRQPIFQSLEEAERERLVEGSHSLRFGRGELIIEQGASGDSMFVLLRGEATVSIQSNGQSSRVAGLRGGDCFGEMSLLTGAPRSATVIAQTDCDVLEIQKSLLAEFLQTRPELSRTLSELLARRQMETDGWIAEKHRAGQPALTDRQRQCAEGFLAKITHFFEL
jgi:small-conductance mechanosensitive channel/CRP-like cAMP-binding protein